MSELTLQSLCAETGALIAGEAHEEAITLCQHTLRHHPKHILSYSLLGRAAAGLGNFREAADMFRRVLSADPENLTARASLGELFATEGAIDEALWQTERAFELSPGDVAVRERLRELRGQRRGSQPNRLKLSGVALGRLYLRGGWYDLAIKEFRALLHDDPARVDVRTALAEALWAIGRRQEAAVVCEELLTELPNCLKANLILGQIWTESGLEEGWSCLQLAQALDPENQIANQVFGPECPLPLQDVKIPPVGTAPPVVVEDIPDSETEELPPWLQSLSAEEETGEELLALMPGFAKARGPWIIDLRAATDQALFARPLLEPEPASVPAVAWAPDLRAATEQALSARPLPEPEPESAPAVAWVPDLQAATEQALRRRRAEVATAALAAEQRLEVVRTGPPAHPAWTVDLRAGTEQFTEGWAARPAPVVIPSWIETLQTATAQALSSPTAAGWAQDLQAATVEAMAEHPPANWVNRLYADTSEALLPQEPLLPQGAPIFTLPVQDQVAATIAERRLAEAEIGALQDVVADLMALETKDAPEEPEAVPPPAPAPTPEEPAGDRFAELHRQVAADSENHAARLELAQAFRLAGERDHALVQFGELVSLESELGPEIVSALEEWGQTAPDDVELQQLLGDAYASVGRLSDALAQYRRALAINR